MQFRTWSGTEEEEEHKINPVKVNITEVELYLLLKRRPWCLTVELSGVE